MSQKRVKKVAVDARPLVPPIKGIGRYLTELLARLVKKYPDTQWLLYSVSPIPDVWRDYDNVSIRQFISGVGPFTSLGVQAVFPCWLLKDKPDAFWSPRHHLPILMPAGINQVVTIHDLVWYFYPQTMTRLGLLLEKALMPRSVKQADSVCVVSRSTGDDVGDVLGRRSGVELIYPGVTINQSAPSSLDSSHSYFLFVGTIEPRKNLSRLLSAFKLALERGAPVSQLRIVGGTGWGKEDLFAQVKSLNLEDHVEFIGFISDTELALQYRYATALLMPSLYEGFGLPILEAMALGVPIVTSNLSSMPEVAGDAALIVKPGDQVDIADAIYRIGCDVKLRLRLSNNARARSTLFSWDESSAKMAVVLGIDS